MTTYIYITRSYGACPSVFDLMCSNVPSAGALTPNSHARSSSEHHSSLHNSVVENALALEANTSECLNYASDNPDSYSLLQTSASSSSNHEAGHNLISNHMHTNCPDPHEGFVDFLGGRRDPHEGFVELSSSVRVSSPNNNYLHASSSELPITTSAGASCASAPNYSSINPDLISSSSNTSPEKIHDVEDSVDSFSNTRPVSLNEVSLGSSVSNDDFEFYASVDQHIFEAFSGT